MPIIPIQNLQTSQVPVGWAFSVICTRLGTILDRTGRNLLIFRLLRLLPELPSSLNSASPLNLSPVDQFPRVDIIHPHGKIGNVIPVISLSRSRRTKDSVFRKEASSSTLAQEMKRTGRRIERFSTTEVCGQGLFAFGSVVRTLLFSADSTQEGFRRFVQSRQGWLRPLSRRDS